MKFNDVFDNRLHVTQIKTGMKIEKKKTMKKKKK
ncbi:hypothetical protein K794_01920, partial [Salmonella enterica subsp. enterica serovar Newport str. SHSN004]